MVVNMNTTPSWGFINGNQFSSIGVENWVKMRIKWDNSTYTVESIMRSVIYVQLSSVVYLRVYFW